MHELSIANALIDSLERLAPPGAVVTDLEITAGPLRAIEPLAMDWAWQAATRNTKWQAVKLHLTIQPYTLKCRACQTIFESNDIDTACPCGATQSQILQSDHLQITSITVEDQPSSLLTTDY